MNYRVMKIVKTKFIHMIHDFADLVSFSSNSIEFHIFGNKAEGKHSRVLKRTRSSFYDFALFGSAKELIISWKEAGRLFNKSISA